MTLQDLKDNKTSIIQYIKDLGCEETTKEFMELMVMGIDFADSIEELMNGIWDRHYRVRAKRSGHKLAEIIGNNENRTYSIMDKSFKTN